MGATLVRRLGREQVTVIPATSSVQVGLRPRRRALGRRAHPQRSWPAAGAGRAPCLDARVSAIFCGPDNPPQRVAEARSAAAWRLPLRRRRAARRSGERVVDTMLSQVARGHFHPMSVVVLDRDASNRRARRTA